MTEGGPANATTSSCCTCTGPAGSWLQDGLRLGDRLGAARRSSCRHGRPVPRRPALGLLRGRGDGGSRLTHASARRTRSRRVTARRRPARLVARVLARRGRLRAAGRRPRSCTSSPSCGCCAPRCCRSIMSSPTRRSWIPWPPALAELRRRCDDRSRSLSWLRNSVDRDGRRRRRQDASPSIVVAFGFARTRFPGRDKLFVLVLATMMIPFHVTLIPQLHPLPATRLAQHALPADRPGALRLGLLRSSSCASSS